MRILSFLLLMLGLACGPGEGTERTQTTSGGTGGGKKASSNNEDSDSEDESETQIADLPTEVTGAFLVCTPVEENGEGDYGCGFRRTEDNELLDA